MRRFVICLVLFLCANVRAATFIVTNTSDNVTNGICDASGVNDGCTLREAINAANLTHTSDTITFQNGFGNTGSHSLIQLGGSLTLNSSININTPPGQSIEVRGNGVGAFGIFIVNSGHTAQLFNLTLSNANVGVDSNGTLNMSNCTLSGNGGGVLNNGTATLNNCTFSNNGNGIFNLETANLNHCTLSGNSTGVNNSGGTVNLRNSIVAGNTTDVSGSVGTDSNNLKNMTAAEAGLDPNGLQENGGPTRTIALQSGSPALDAANSTLLTDQRGQPRPDDNPAIANAPGGNGSDIGAFELEFIPSVSVNNPRSLPEGSVASPGSVTFDVTLNAASTQSVTVNYQTANGTENPALAGSDYVAKTGKLTFAPGETLKRVTVSFIGDSTVELNETFFFDLKTATNATISDGRGVGQINNDDGPGITITNAVTINEGNGGTTSQTFAVTLSAASANTVTVDWTTADGTAKASTDYVAASGTLSFAPGQTSKTVTVSVKGDSTVEAHETYKVVLSKVAYAFIADGTGIGTIRNDDAAALIFENDEPSQ